MAATVVQSVGSRLADTTPPTKYHRLIARRTGHSFREVAEVEEVQWVSPGPEEVSIRVAYAGVNGGCETFRARGEFAFAGNKKAESFLLGAEGVGHVVAVGEGVENYKVGQPVACTGAGAFSEYATAKAAMCWPLDAATQAAVALTISGLTAAAALHGTGGMQASDTVLVTAAAGATGHFGVQLALLAGCRVVATCGGERKAQRLRQLGVHQVIDYHAEDVGDVLAREFPKAITLAYEGVGGSLRNAVLENLAEDGRMLLVGYISEYPHNAASGKGTGAGTQLEGIPASQDLFWGAQTVKRGRQTLFGNVWPKDRGEVLRCKQMVFDLHRQGKLQAWVDDGATFSGLQAVCDAIDYMLTGQAIGKVVVKL